MSLDKSVENITEADLVSLIEAGTPELKTLEYKEALRSTRPALRRNFWPTHHHSQMPPGTFNLRDASGIRSGDGAGWIASRGRPNHLQARKYDPRRNAPRIPGLHSFAVKLANSKIAVVIRIPKSFASPHMVKFQGTSRFYSRTSNGKYQLDVQELRAAFLGSETTGERIRDFRFDRLANIRARETSIPLRAGAFAALHIIPINAFGANDRTTLSR